jgi:hypothetical protein
VRRATVCLAVSAGLVLSGLALQPASAAPGTGGWADTGNLADGWQAQAGSVQVTVNGATGGRNISRSFSGPPPYCRYVPYKTADEIEPESGLGDQEFSYEDIGYDPVTRLPLDIEQRRGTEGRYWVPMCGGVPWPGDDASRDALIDEFFANNNITFIGPGDALPVQPVPAAVLLDIAMEYLQPPAPEVGVNPAARSVVNFETWVWAEPDTFGEMTIRAESGPNFAEIVARGDHMTLSAPAAAKAGQKGNCADGGTEYRSGARNTNCSITFGRSSAISPGGWPLSVVSTWTATATTSDGPQPPLAPVDSPTETVDIPVAEVQALVG